MTGVPALVVLLLVTILAPCLYFVFLAEADELDRRPRSEDES